VRKWQGVIERVRTWKKGTLGTLEEQKKKKSEGGRGKNSKIRKKAVQQKKRRKMDRCNRLQRAIAHGPGNRPTEAKRTKKDLIVRKKNWRKLLHTQLFEGQGLNGKP